MRKRMPKKSPIYIFYVSLFSLAVLVGLGFLFISNFSPSPLTALSTMASDQQLKQDQGRVTGLLLGIDRRVTITSSEHGVLTDTIMVVSTDVSTGETVVISLPRDLWVPLPDGSWGKINAAYATGVRQGESGAKYTALAVERVLGIPIQYYAVIGFDGFVRAVDTLGGIDVEVMRSFDDYMYPIPGRENVMPEEDRYEHLHFDSGWQHMDGETALKFARSRKALGPEGSDFARSSRQQKVIAAVKDKFFSVETLLNPSKIRSLYSEFIDSIETNVELAEARQFLSLAQKIDNIQYIVLNGSGPNDPVLLKDVMEEDLYGGAYVLVPIAGDYSEVQAWVQKTIY